MEKINFERIIGGTDDQKEKVINTFKEAQSRTPEELFGNLLVEQTPEEKEIIKEVVQYGNKIAKEYGSNREFDLNKIYVLKEGGVLESSKGEHKTGLYSSYFDLIVADRNSNPDEFKAVIMHEFFHSMGYHTIQIKKDNESLPYRHGISMTGRYNEGTYFHNANEAIVATLTHKYLAEDLKLERTERERMKEVEQFNQILEDLVKDSNGKIKDTEELFDLFAQAHFTGNYLPLAKVIDQSVGKGTFRKIAMDLGVGKIKVENEEVFE